MLKKEINIESARVLLSILSEHGEEGCGIISLTLKTGIPQTEIREFFLSRKSFCTPIIGRSKFKINSKAPFMGCVDAMVRDLERELVASRRSSSIDLSFGWNWFLTRL